MANEKRLIDANALSDKVDESKHDNPHPQGMIRVNHRTEHDHFLRMILDAPTVDAVEVVRCKNCESYDISGCYEGFGWCFLHDKGKTDNDYCSCGAKMDGDGNDQ